MSSYLAEFGGRFQDISGVASWAFLAFLAAAFGVWTRRAKPAALVRWPLVTTLVGLPVWMVHLFIPAAVPYLGALAFGVTGTLIGAAQLPRLAARLGHPLTPTMQIAVMLVGCVVSFVVALALPTFISGLVGACFACVFVVRALESRRLPLFRGKAAGAAAPAGVGLDGLKVSEDGLHGSAGWGDYQAAKAGKHLGAAEEPGLALGRLDGVPAGPDDRFRFLGHVVTCAPTGSGKGIGAVIPNLLEYPGSAFVLDIKGENYAVTHRRRGELGRVHVVDPFGITGAASAGCNFMDRLDLSNPDCISRSASLAECLVIAGRGEDGHFDELARSLLQGIMLHVAGGPADRRHLGEVRRLLTLGEDGFLHLMADMSADPDAAYGLPARTAATLMATGDRERGSILSTARRSTAFLDDPRIIDTLSRTDFDFGKMKTETITVYLVIPADKLEFYFRYLRGFIGTALSCMTSNQQKPKRRVVFFLDEFAQLGRMTAVEKAISLARGYGVVFWLFIQDLSQLKDAYDDKWQTFMANAAKHFFGTDDYDTAEYISKSLGKATIEYETAGSSRKITEIAGSNSQNVQFAGRDLLTPDEVMRLGAKPIVIVRGEPPYMLDRLNYLDEPEYAGQYDPNPYH